MAGTYILALAAAAATAAARRPSATDGAFVAATDPRLKWVGRRLDVGNGALAIDWELTSVSITIANATMLYASITDGSSKGARFAVFLNNSATFSSASSSSSDAPAAQQPHTAAGTSSLSTVSLAAGGDPNAHSDFSPNLRVQTFLTGPGTNSYPIGNRAGTDKETATWTLTLLTEPNFIGDFKDSEALIINGFETDGVVLPCAYPYSSRRIEFLGDSLTAGYGSGFDQPPGQPACGAGTMINDAANSYGAVLCANFSADCQIEAVSGITLSVDKSYNLPQLWPYELGSMYQYWSNKVAFNASRWVPQAVVINLGENDWNGDCGNSPGCIQDFSAAYVAFVQNLTAAYGVSKSSITYFATIAPHEKGQSVGILPAVSTLQGQGYSIHFLNATVQESAYPAGCGGHPGPSIHAAAAARAQPVIAAAMGW